MNVLEYSKLNYEIDYEEVIKLNNAGLINVKKSLLCQ